MSDTILTSIRRVRRRYRLLQTAGGACQVLALGTVLVLIAALLDWNIRPDDPALRVALAGFVAAGILATVWCRVVRPAFFPPSDLDVACWIETRHRQLAGGLSSAVEFFARQCPQSIGSCELQQASIASAQARLETINDSLTYGAGLARRRMLQAVGTVVIAGLVVLVVPIDTVIAVQRLINPFGTDAWPRLAQLQILSRDETPLFAGRTRRRRIAAGQPLEFLIANRRGRIPEDTVIELHDPGLSRVERIPIDAAASDSLVVSEGGQAVARSLVLAGSKRIRAIGGDDATDWFELVCVPGPRLHSARMTLIPPDYSGRQAVELESPHSAVRDLIGTRLEIRAHATKTLRSAVLIVDDGDPVEAALDDESRRLTAVLTIERDGMTPWRIDVRDNDGLVMNGALSGRVRGLEDMPPVLTIDVPARTAVPKARLPIHVVATDDVALREIRLRYQVDQTGPRRTVTIYPTDRSPPTDRVDMIQQWDLSPVDARIRSVLRFHLEATDVGDASDHGTIRTIEHRLEIVEPDRKLAELAGEFDVVKRGILSAAREQARIREDVNKHLDQPERESLRSIQRRQLRLEDRLTGAAAGLQRRNAALRDQLDWNQQNASRLAEEVEGLALWLEELRKQQLSEIHRDLELVLRRRESGRHDSPGTESGNGTQPSHALADDTVLRVLSRIADNQAVVVRRLNSAVAAITVQKRWQLLAGELHNIRDEQHTVHRETNIIHRQTLSRALYDLTPDERRRLAGLSGMQKSVERSVLRASASLAQSDFGLGADGRALSEGVELVAVATQLSVLATRMRSVAEHLSANRTGEALSVQAAILSELETMVAAFDRSEQTQSLTSAENVMEDLDKIISQQQDITDGVRTVRQEIEATGRRARSQSRRLLDLVQRQSQLRDTLAAAERFIAASDLVRSSCAAALDGMATAEGRLRRRLADQQTMAALGRALDGLTMIRDAISETAVSGTADARQDDFQSGTQRRDASGDDSGTGPDNGDGSGRPARNPGSTENPQPPRDAAAVRAEFDQLWQHLPETIRRELPDPASERHVREYEDVIRRYFRSLADQPRY